MTSSGSTSPAPQPRPVSMDSAPPSSSGSSMCGTTCEVIMEEDKPVVPGVHVRAASLDGLVDVFIHCFDPHGPSGDEDSANFPHTFLLMHKWFTTSEDFALKLIELCQNPDTAGIDPCSHGCPSSCRNCDIFRYKAKICQGLRYWIRTFPVHFDMDHRLSAVLRSFQLLLVEAEYEDLANLVDLSKVPSYDWMRSISVRNPNAKVSRKVSLVFNHLEPNELSEHLTYLEHKAMRRISFQDFKNYAQHGTLKDNPKLERSIALFNSLSQWVQCMVLSKARPQQRAEVIVKFVEVAKKLRELSNFNTLMAVVGGLCHSALARLSKTMACVPQESQKSLQELTELLSSASNFSNYRKALNDSTDFRIPILGVHMKDLIALHVALPDFVEGGLNNFRKMAQLSVIFAELTQLQNSTLPIEVNMDLVNTLRLSLDLAYTEDEIYELSLAIEPRNSISNSPTKPTVFAEWAAGVCTPPDPETIQKHVTAMVEAVFKNYDNDRDGYISQAEFEAIAGNFPFIDSFCVLDADQDGMISKDEMRDYFIRANCHALRSGFKHDFHETTYFRPTFCAHCTGLLWGLIKQGYKCRDCGINSHKHCKDQVVMECRRFTTPRSNSMPSADGTQIRHRFKHRRRQHKFSQSQPDSDAPPPSPKLCSSTSSLPTLGNGHSLHLHGIMSNGSSPNLLSRVDSRADSGGLICGHEGLVERLVIAEEARDKLLIEKHGLQEELEAARREISELRQHMGEVRQQTINFILRQMETLKMQKDTPV